MVSPGILKRSDVPPPEPDSWNPSLKVELPTPPGLTKSKEIVSPPVSILKKREEPLPPPLVKEEVPGTPTSDNSHVQPSVGSKRKADVALGLDKDSGQSNKIAKVTTSQSHASRDIEKVQQKSSTGIVKRQMSVPARMNADPRKEKNSTSSPKPATGKPEDKKAEVVTSKKTDASIPGNHTTTKSKPVLVSKKTSGVVQKERVETVKKEAMSKSSVENESNGKEEKNVKHLKSKHAEKDVKDSNSEKEKFVDAAAEKSKEKEKPKEKTIDQKHGVKSKESKDEEIKKDKLGKQHDEVKKEKDDFVKKEKEEIIKKENYDNKKEKEKDDVKKEKEDVKKEKEDVKKEKDEVKKGER